MAPFFQFDLSLPWLMIPHTIGDSLPGELLPICIELVPEQIQVILGLPHHVGTLLCTLDVSRILEFAITRLRIRHDARQYVIHAIEILHLERSFLHDIDHFHSILLEFILKRGCPWLVYLNFMELV